MKENQRYNVIKNRKTDFYSGASSRPFSASWKDLVIYKKCFHKTKIICNY
jgi:hypothetical protein